MDTDQHQDLEQTHEQPALQTDPLKSAINNNLFARAKKYFIYIAIGSVIVSALITIISILVGQFNDITWRALGTTLSISIHAMLALAFVTANGKNTKPGDRLILNVVFVEIVASFLDTIFGIWGVISADIAVRVYSALFWAFVGSVIVRALLPTYTFSNALRRLCVATIGMTVLLYLLLLPFIFWTSDTADLPDFYFRILAAAAVLEGTLCVLAAIFHKLYATKLKEEHALSDPPKL